MQLISSQGKYVEKIIRDTHGQLVRVTFFVYESGGRIKARLVQSDFITSIATQIASKVDTILALCGGIGHLVSTRLFGLTGKIVSPYVSSNILYFSGSKPRAPAF